MEGLRPTQQNKNDKYPPDGSTYLHKLMSSSKQGDKINNINMFLRLDPNVDLQNDMGQTGLMLGIANGLTDEDVIDQILKKSTNIKLKDNNENTLLHYFCTWGVPWTDTFDESVYFAENNKGEVPLHHVRNDEVLCKLFEKYKEYKKWPHPSGKSELFTNLEDYCKFPNERKEKKKVIERFCACHNEEAATDHYPVPRDLPEIISYAIKYAAEAKKDKNDAEFRNFLNILKDSILPYCKESINVQNIEDSIDTDNKAIFDSVVGFCDIKSLVSASPSLILKSLTADINGASFYRDIKAYLNKDLTKIMDDSGCNIAHYLCKYGKIDLFYELMKSEDAIAVEKLFSLPDKNDSYPLAYAIDNKQSQYFEFFNLKFKESSKGYTSIMLATSKSDLLHYAIDSGNTKMVKVLVGVDFPLNEDSNGLTPIHKIVLSSAKPKSLKEMLDHLKQVKTSEEERISYINKLDAFELRALDYAAINGKEEQFREMRSRGAEYDKERAEKMVHYLVGERGLDEDDDDVMYLLEMFTITCPQEPKTEFIDEIKELKANSDNRRSHKLCIQASKQPTIYNILIVHPDNDHTIVADLCNKQAAQGDCRVLCHSIPLEYFSFTDAHHFNCLYNRRLIVRYDHADMSVMKLLSALLLVSDDRTERSSNIIDIPSKFFHSKITNETSLAMPPDELLNVDEEIVKITVEHREVLEIHQDKSGFFFVADDFYLRHFYHTSLQPDSLEVDKQAALYKLGLLDMYYTLRGEEKFHRRIKPKSNNSVVVAGSSTDLYIKVTYETDAELLNVSRFAVPAISSCLVKDHLLIPAEEDTLLLVSPDISITFSICKAGSDGDVIKVSLVNTAQEGGSPSTTDIQRYILSLLRKVGKSLRNVDILLGIFCVRDPDTGAETLRFCSITGEKMPRQETYKKEEGTLENVAAENWKLIHGSTALSGDSFLIAADLSAIEGAVVEIKSNPLELYFKDEGSCLLEKNCTTIQLLQRICLMRKGYTVRQFIHDGQWSAEERQAICSEIGIPVAQTYTKLQNCVRLNWADVLVLVVAIIVTVGILVCCKMGGVDLGEFGVAGVATVPFIIALLNRCRKSYSHNPEDYSKLPSIIPA